MIIVQLGQKQVKAESKANFFVVLMKALSVTNSWSIFHIIWTALGTVTIIVLHPNCTARDKTSKLLSSHIQNRH